MMQHSGTSGVPLSYDVPINILIVDDEPKNLTVLETILNDPGYRLVRANSADEALLALVAEEFALLILDIRMPGMTGFELATIIKERKKTARVPIIFLTAYYNEDQHVLAGYDTGAVDYLHKPVNPPVLRSKVSVFAELYRKNREIVIANRSLLSEVSQRRDAQEQLRDLNDTLEQRVAERTEELAKISAALKQTNIELERARVKSEQASRAKSEFLSSMSHELRTPLHAILGFTQLLHSATPPPSADDAEHLQQVLRSGWHLLELINEILDLSQIESGTLALSLEPVSLVEIIRECKVMIEPLAQKRGSSIDFVQNDESCNVLADRIRLKQVVINLLSNAIKYGGENGTVTVDFAGISLGRIRVNIRDKGAGLSPEQLEMVFQPFNRLGQELGNEEGAGIGLVLSKRLVEGMGGLIGAVSTVGLGSAFWFDLDAAVDAPREVFTTKPWAIASSAGLHRQPQPSRTLLYIEDNPANLKLVEHLLARIPDVRLLSAIEANEGIRIARTYQPDVILMDINLPGLSGIEALSLLREDPATARIPVIALSANAMPRDIRKGLQAGFYRYLTKPLRLHELTEMLDSVLEINKAASRKESDVALDSNLKEKQ